MTMIIKDNIELSKIKVGDIVFLKNDRTKAWQITGFLNNDKTRPIVMAEKSIVLSEIERAQGKRRTAFHDDVR